MPESLSTRLVNGDVQVRAIDYRAAVAYSSMKTDDDSHSMKLDSEWFKLREENAVNQSRVVNGRMVKKVDIKRK